MFLTRAWQERSGSERGRRVSWQGTTGVPRAWRGQSPAWWAAMQGLSAQIVSSGGCLASGSRCRQKEACACPSREVRVCGGS